VLFRSVTVSNLIVVNKSLIHNCTAPMMKNYGAESEKYCHQQLCNRLSSLSVSGNHSFGLIKLDELCVLEARFESNYYDSFKVKDSSAIKAAIEKVNPSAAIKMNRNLHMTVSYPGKQRIPGLSEADKETFADSSDFPTVLLQIAEIHLSRDGNFAAAVISGIDSAVMFAFNNNGTPAHLTLWGYPPVMAGQQLIGLPLALRSPFIQVTAERVAASMASKNEQIKSLKLCISKTERELLDANALIGVMHQILNRWIVCIQSNVRLWLARRLVTNLRCMNRLSSAQRSTLRRFIQKMKNATATQSHRENDNDFNNFDYEYYDY